MHYVPVLVAEVKSWVISLTDAIKASLSSASYVPSRESTMKEPSLGAEGGLTTNKDKKCVRMYVCMYSRISLGQTLGDSQNWFTQ